MIKHILLRDTISLLSRLSFWIVLAGLSIVYAILLLSFFEDFSVMQPELIKNEINKDISDIVISPYLRVTGIISAIFISIFCSRLFHFEFFSSYSNLEKSLGMPYNKTIKAKVVYVKIFSFILLLLSILPVIILGLNFDYDYKKLAISTISTFILLISTGLVSTYFSMKFSQTIIVFILTIIVLSTVEILTKLTTEPIWLINIFSYFSPIHHFYRTSSGIISTSDIVFSISFITLFYCLIVRENKNRFL